MRDKPKGSYSKSNCTTSISQPVSDHTSWLLITRHLQRGKQGKQLVFMYVTHTNPCTGRVQVTHTTSSPPLYQQGNKLATPTLILSICHLIEAHSKTRSTGQLVLKSSYLISLNLNYKQSIVASITSNQL